MTPEVGNKSGDTPTFRGRINQRLSLIFGLLFFLVLLAGGASLYLVRAITLASAEIAKGSERVHSVENIQNTIHDFFSALLRAGLEDKKFTDSRRKSYLYDLDALLEKYRKISEGNPGAIDEIQAIVGEVAAVSERIAAQTQSSAKLPGKVIHPQELTALRNVELKIEAFAHRESRAHEILEEGHIRESQQKMDIVIDIYVAFVFVGGLLILGASIFFHWTIAQPLRWLVAGTSEIAKGNFDNKVPVTRKDEIGQLSHAFNIMVDRLRNNEERLKGLVALGERERIAQELHDSIAQELALLHLKLIEAERSLPPNELNAATGERLREMRKIADRAYEDIRQAIFGLRTMVSKGLGLMPTLTEYLHDLSEITKIPVSLHSPEGISFSLEVEVQLIRIIHEALANVIKHAQASQSAVKFEREGDAIKITIEDDGKGFVPEQVVGKKLHFGLKTMRERAEAIGGNLAVESAPGKGTRVIVILPFKERPDETHSLAGS